MVMRSQQTLPLRDSTRHNDGRPVAVVTRSSSQDNVRWGAAIHDPRKGQQVIAWEELKNQPRRGRRTRATAESARSQLAGQPQVARRRLGGQQKSAASMDAATGATFARNRIQRGLDLFGACMMIVTFLAFAMFA